MLLFCCTNSNKQSTYNIVEIKRKKINCIYDAVMFLPFLLQNVQQERHEGSWRRDLKRNCRGKGRQLIFNFWKVVTETSEGKIQRDFLLGLTQDRRLEPKTGRVIGQCAGCGRDIYSWELATGYAAFDGDLFCDVCLWGKRLDKRGIQKNL